MKFKIIPFAKLFIVSGLILLSIVKGILIDT